MNFNEDTKPIYTDKEFNRLVDKNLSSVQRFLSKRRRAQLVTALRTGMSGRQTTESWEKAKKYLENWQRLRNKRLEGSSDA